MRITKIKDLNLLPRLRDSLSYLYVEHAKIEQENHAIAIHDAEGITHVPIASLTVLMLGPGTAVTHAAIKALADNGCLVNWVGEDSVRFYAQGVGETRKAYHLLCQAELSCNPVTRLQVIERMYRARFDEHLEPGLSLQVIRGMEGARVRKAYAEAGKHFGVRWVARNYDRDNWNSADPLNRALSSANACLNALCHAAIVSGGYSPGLGFVHTGKQMSFVYDVADLYKVAVTVPVAFRTVSEGTHQLESRVRQNCRNAFRQARLLERILPDIDRLLEVPGEVAGERDVDPDAADAAKPEEWWGDDGLQLGDIDSPDGSGGQES